MIAFNRPPVLGTELSYISEAIRSQNKLSGDGPFTKKCHDWLETQFHVKKALLTPSCTAALEMAALLLDIGPDDEVIMPSYTFVSTANAFALRGAKIVFVDVSPETMNIDPMLIEEAITANTKAIVLVHYAGISCDMDCVLEIAKRYDLYVVEDAAQAMMSTYRDRALGSMGHLGCFSFHETKNYTAGGEGGALLINDERFIERAEIIREKGTNRAQFLRGQVDKYTWRDIGSSYLPSELQAAYLFAQFEGAALINARRHELWNAYHQAFQSLAEEGLCEVPHVPDWCTHNAHLYYLKLNSLAQRSLFIERMNRAGVNTVFHYIPLHLSPAGRNYGRFHGVDNHTLVESERLVRLPLWFNMTDKECAAVVERTQTQLKAL